MSARAVDIPMRVFASLLVFTILLVHGALLGMTDDEAYYWFLAQDPGLGFAFHPPGVVWLIAFFQKMFGWIFGAATPGLARLPAFICGAGIMWLGLGWVGSAAGVSGRPRTGIAALVIGAYAGVFAAAWMIVPDLPLFLGWMLLFTASWEVAKNQKCDAVSFLMLASGAAIAMLSKYSGVIAAGSAGLAILIWGGSARLHALGAIAAGFVLGILPPLAWNIQNDWGSLMYQLRDRHGGGGFSGVRWLKFWGSQLLLAGPALVFFTGALFAKGITGFRYRKGTGARVLFFVLVWMLPHALVFCVQPAWSDFKPHWAFVVWLPGALYLAFVAAGGAARVWRNVHVAYGLLFGALAILMCHVPLLAWFNVSVLGRNFDPRWDVTNDMHGWKGLRLFLDSAEGGRYRALPVIGSRYQTASQAAFALGDAVGAHRVSFIPRSAKERAEWPESGVTDGFGPAWPRLLKPVLFVTDNRYSAPPAFMQAECGVAKELVAMRWSYEARRIKLWFCSPS
ncbi:MAG: hypothetical protein A2583_13735 [Bdellovibrionales bacterium RIFOXYD1_FULL_53_11]|nr:MAG: hypothetical protein A2583_13735 [Bdellovibrionales bacterium RIFOXYD1_FULL_53_11]